MVTYKIIPNVHKQLAVTLPSPASIIPWSYPSPLPQRSAPIVLKRSSDDLGISFLTFRNAIILLPQLSYRTRERFGKHRLTGFRYPIIYFLCFSANSFNPTLRFKKAHRANVVILSDTDEDEIREMLLRLQNGTTLKAQQRRNAM